MTVPVKPYEGKEPYIFISYSHRDSDRVFPILRHLADEGFRIWYDEGIDPGTEWPESIATHLANSKACIAFISDNSLASQNCRREINFALSRNHIGFLSVMLEDAKMTPGVEMQLSTYQSLMVFKYPAIEGFYEKLDRVDLLQPCRKVKESAAPAAPKAEPAKPAETPAAASKPAEFSKAETGKKKLNLKVLIPIIVGAAVVVAAAIILPIVLSKKPNVDPDNSKEAETTQAPSKESTAAPSEDPSEDPTEPFVLELSDNLEDYTFRLDGTVYQLPLSFSELTDTGWTIDSTGISDETPVEGNKDKSFQMVNNGAKITVIAVNSEEEPCAIKDCMIGGIEVRQSGLKTEDEFSVAKEITPFSSMEEVLDTLGTIADLNTGNSSRRLSYGLRKTASTVFQFYDDMANYNTIGVYCYPTHPPVAAATELSDNLPDFTFLLDGALYQLPFDFSELKDNGWQISSSGHSEQFLIGGYDDEVILLKKNGSAITVRVVNTGGNARPVSECLVGNIEVTQQSMLEMSFQVAKGIGLSATKKDLEKAFGEASKNDYSDYSVLSYGDEYTVQSKFYVYDKKTEYNKIQLTNMPETLVEYTETALEAPAYLAQYTAPSSLGDDLLSGNVKIGGDLYRFPAPVSEFLKNGWTVRSRPGFVGAYQINTMTLEKGGLILDLSIENLAEVQTTAENCAAYGAQIKADSGLSYELPRGVMLGAAGSVLDGLDVKFSTSDSKEYTSYTAYDSKAGVNLTIQVGKENHQIITITFRKTNWDQ